MQGQTVGTRTISELLKQPVDAQAVSALRESIVNGEVAPGARLKEIHLSKKLGLSRAAVRAALRQLLTEGLVTLVPYTGWAVTAFGEKDVWELYTLRAALERLASRSVAAEMTERKELAIRRAFDRLIKRCVDRDPIGIAEADFSLHKEIVQLAVHSRLATQYGYIEQQIRLYIRSSDALIVNPTEIVEQHQPIVEALLAGDIERAGALSEQHNHAEGEKLLLHVRSAG